MNLWTKKELIAALGTEIINHNLSKLQTLRSVIIDSRKVEKNSLFIALKGENNDGHDYLLQAFKNGSCLAIIDSETVFKNQQNNLNLILVKNTFKALHKLASYSQKRTKAKIIAITGSVGKTSVKEMLKLVFSSQGKTFASYGNLNNHIGLPLSLANMPGDCDYGIFEMGMNHLNEISILSKLAKPDIAIITNIAAAHIGNFKNEQEIALAKSEIFLGLKKNGLAIINRDNKYCNFLIKKASQLKIKSANIVTFGSSPKANYRLIKTTITNSTKASLIVATKNNGQVSYDINNINKSVANNSLIAIAALDLVGKNILTAIKTLKNFQIPNSRGSIIEIKQGRKNFTIIDDSYNANIASVAAGVEYLADLKNALKKKRSVAILGDMLELGKDAAKIHIEIAKYLKQFKIDYSLLVGDLMKNLAKKLNYKNCELYASSDQLALRIKDLLKDGDIVLIKGSRGTKMENIIAELQNK
jgi:UDP-N-acetylmuramoyl-tripeptide--D-alanyl-D-alanine ligase